MRSVRWSEAMATTLQAALRGCWRISRRCLSRLLPVACWGCGAGPSDEWSVFPAGGIDVRSDPSFVRMTMKLGDGILFIAMNPELAPSALFACGFHTGPVEGSS